MTLGAMPPCFIFCGANYIANGRTRSKCFLTREGGLTVSFSGEQMLHGAYGGEEGRPRFPGESIDYAFSVCLFVQMTFLGYRFAVLPLITPLRLMGL